MPSGLCVRFAVNPKVVFLIPLFTFLFPIRSSAQNVFLDPRVSMSSDDFQLGARAGGEAVLRRYIPVDFFLELDGSLPLRTVKIQTSPNTFYQYRERRFYFSPGASAGLPVGESGFWTTAAGLGYSFAYYRGSNRDPPSRWTPWVETGFRFMFSNHGMWGLSYRYQPDREASAHRISFEIGYRVFSARDVDD